MHQHGLTRSEKKPSMKADLAIYSHTVDAAGQCMSESLLLGHNLDFSTCDILVSFCKSICIWRNEQLVSCAKNHVSYFLCI